MIIDHVCVDILQFYCNSKIIAIPQVPIIIIPQSPSRLPHGALGQATQGRFLSSLTNILSRLMRETMMIIMSYLTTWCVSSYILLMIVSSRPLCRAGCSVTTWRAFLDTSTIHPGSSNSYHLTRTLRLECLSWSTNRLVLTFSSAFRLWDWTLSWILHSVIPQMQLLARLPKRDSPSLATRQAGSKVANLCHLPTLLCTWPKLFNSGKRCDSLSKDREAQPTDLSRQRGDPVSSSWQILSGLLLVCIHRPNWHL